MIKQSDLALAAWKATERTLDAIVTINKTDYKTTDIASISYDAGGYTGDTFGIGSNYENSISVKFSHLVEGLKPGMTVIPKIGVKTSSGYEYSSLGVFIVSDDIQMDRNNDETTIKAYDQMCLMEGTYTSKLTYPAKMVNVIAEIANLAGVLLNTEDISRLPVQADLPSVITGQTYRNAIGMIAQFYAGFATFDRDGKLTIRTITEPDYTLDPSQYEQGGLTKNEAPYTIGGIQCEVTTTTTDSTGQSTEITSTLQVGSASGSQIKLTNNLMTTDRLQVIWSQIGSVNFYPFSLNWFGNPAIEAGDWLTLQDTKGNKFNVPNNGYTMTFDGSLSAVSKADQASTSSSSYAWRGQLSQTISDLGGRQGASGNYIYGTDTTVPPYGAKFNDLWYKQNGNKVELWTYERQSDGTGKWVLTVSDSTGEEVRAQVNEVAKEAQDAVDAANSAVATANEIADTAGFAKDTALKAQADAGTAMTNALQALNDASGLVDKVTTNAADIENDGKLLALKANQTDVDAVAGRVTTAESSIKIMNDQVTQSVSHSELVSQLTGYATQSWTQGQIVTSADKLQLSVAKVQSNIDNLGADLPTVTQLTNLQITLDGIQGTVADEVNGIKAQQTLLASQYTSLIESRDNLVIKSWFDDGSKGGWTSGNVVSDNNIRDNINGHANYLHLTGRDSEESGAGFSVSAWETYYFSGWLGSWGTPYSVSFGLHIYKDDGTTAWISAIKIPAGTKQGLQYMTGSLTIPKGGIKAYPWLQIDGLITASDLGSAGAAGLRISRNAGSSQITQLQNDINLRVTNNGIINAINISAEGTQIYGNKLRITASTFIDDATIKSAMIDTITADKLTTGTLNGDNVHVINLDASHITTGTLTGTNLQINLNTGEVNFQKGRIHSSSNNIDINVDAGYMSVANGNTRVMMKDGEMQFVEPKLLDTESSPYLRISNSVSGASFSGASFVGRDYAVFSNSANDGSIFTSPLGMEKFSGISTGQGLGGWQPTKIGGAERGVFISGGQQTTWNQYATNDSSYIFIGSNDGVHGYGSQIFMNADFVHIKSAYVRTTSASSNLYVADDGALVRSTSASKYKTNITRGFSTDYGEKLICLPTATWIDKASLARHNEDPSQPVPGLNYGMIAEDLAAAGLEHLVVRNQQGGLEGIQYDRIAVALLPLLKKQQDEIEKLKQKLEVS